MFLQTLSALLPARALTTRQSGDSAAEAHCRCARGFPPKAGDLHRKSENDPSGSLQNSGCGQIDLGPGNTISKYSVACPAWIPLRKILVAEPEVLRDALSTLRHSDFIRTSTAQDWKHERLIIGERHFTLPNAGTARRPTGKIQDSKLTNSRPRTSSPNFVMTAYYQPYFSQSSVMWRGSCLSSPRSTFLTISTSRSLARATGVHSLLYPVRMQRLALVPPDLTSYIALCA